MTTRASRAWLWSPRAYTQQVEAVHVAWLASDPARTWDGRWPLSHASPHPLVASGTARGSSTTLLALLPSPASIRSPCMSFATLRTRSRTDVEACNTLWRMKWFVLVCRLDPNMAPRVQRFWSLTEPR
jgi:hypothetical protein